MRPVRSPPGAGSVSMVRAVGRASRASSAALRPLTGPLDPRPTAGVGRTVVREGPLSVLSLELVVIATVSPDRTRRAGHPSRFRSPWVGIGGLVGVKEPA